MALAILFIIAIPIIGIVGVANFGIRGSNAPLICLILLILINVVCLMDLIWCISRIRSGNHRGKAIAGTAISATDLVLTLSFLMPLIIIMNSR